MARADQVTQNARTEDPLTTAMNAIANGQDAAEAVYGKGVVGFDRNEESEPMEDNNPMDQVEETGEDSTQEDSTEANPSEEDDAPTLEKIQDKSKPQAQKLDIEEVSVKSADGKRKSLKIDYTNKEVIKQKYLQAEGMNLFRQQRDNLKKEFETYKKTATDKVDSYDKLDKIFQEQGAKGVLLQLAGPDGLKKLVEEETRHREYLSSLTPDEKHRLNLKQQEEQLNRKFAEMENKVKQREEEYNKREEITATRSIESKLHPSFDRYRFAGKLGDPVAEADLDEALWNKVVMKNLTQYPDDVELTQALIDKEFRSAAQRLQSVIAGQTQKSVVKTIDKKKAEAAKNAQLVAKKGMTAGGEKEKFVESIKSGNILDAIGSMMSGKIKL